jgi:hypothetical protein
VFFHYYILRHGDSFNNLKIKKVKSLDELILQRKFDTMGIIENFTNYRLKPLSLDDNESDESERDDESARDDDSARDDGARDDENEVERQGDEKDHVEGDEKDQDYENNKSDLGGGEEWKPRSVRIVNDY